MRLQSNLGTIEPSSRGDLNTGGVISLARIVKVYNDQNTCDVVMQTNAVKDSGENTEGKITCIKLEDYVGWNSELKIPYGKVTPMVEGQLVIIGHIDSEKAKAVILKSFPPHINEYNLSPKEVSEDGFFEKEKEEKITVHPDLSYSYMNGLGEFEKVSSSKAFFVGMQQKISDQRDGDFNYENLAIKNKILGGTIKKEEKDYDYKPFNYLLVTKDQYEDKGATFNRLYHDAESGVTRFTKDDDEKVFYIQLDEGGNFEIRHHLDTNRRDFTVQPSEGETLRESDHDIWESEKKNTLKGPTKDFVSLKIDDKGTIEANRTKGSNKTKIKQKENELKLSLEGSGGNCSIELKNGNINIKATGTITINGSKVKLN